MIHDPYITAVVDYIALHRFLPDIGDGDSLEEFSKLSNFAINGSTVD